METKVEWITLHVNHDYLMHHVPSLPPIINELSLLNLQFESAQTVLDFLAILRGRKISTLTIINTTISTAHALIIVSMSADLELQRLTLARLDLGDKICEGIRLFGCALKHIDLSYNPDITFRGITALCSISPNSLDLSGVPLDAVPSDVWSDIVSSVESFVARNCFRHPNAFTKACDMLFATRCKWRLLDLNLVANNLCTYDAAKLLYVLTQKKVQLRELHLEYNQLDDRVLAVVAKTTSAKHVYLNYNQDITTEGVKSMLDVYATNTSMKHLSLLHCSVDWETIQRVGVLNEEHRRGITTARAKLSELVDVPDIIDDAIALL